MRSEIRTAIAVLATAAVLLGSATMALAADGDAADPAPAETTASGTPTATETTPSPSATETSPSPSTTAPTTPEPTETTSGPTPSPTTPAPAAPPTGAFTVTDAQVRWGVNDESNNRAFAPGTFNFFSAGRIGDPGAGNMKLNDSDRGATWSNGRAAGWSAASGNVMIQKYLDGAWAPATWAGLKTDTTGVTIPSTSGPFSGHEIVISGGTGTVDPTAGSASIQWAGSFTVIYYSGYSFFYVTDPKLTVTNGVGILTGTLSGFRSSMENLDAWQAVTPVPDVTLADLGRVDLGADLGFSAAPAYSGVAVNLAGDQVPQVRTGPWGSFPQSFIDYQTTSGTGAYWYSSGGSADAHKVAKPVTVSYAAGAPVKVAPPQVKKTKKAKKSTTENDAPQAPLARAIAPPGVTAPALALPPPSTTEAVQSAPVTTQLRPASTVIGARLAGDPTSTAGVWVLGGVLLAAAVLIIASPFAYTAIRRAD